MIKSLSKKKASMLNMVFMGAYQIVTALFGFVLPSMILNTYGASLHGYTTTVSNIMSYVALVNAGLAPAAVQALYTPLAKKDTYRLNQILNAIGHFYTISGCLYTIIVVIIACILPFILSNQLPSMLIALLMIVIGASSTLECFIYSKYKVLLQADQRLFVVSIADIIMYFIRIGLQIGLIWAKASIVVVMIIPAVMVIFRMLVLSIYCKNNYPGLDKKVKRDNSALSKRWSAMAHQLAGLIVNNTDVTLLTLFGNLVQVSIYSVYNLVFQKLYEFMTNIFSSGTLSSFGQLMSQNKRESLLRNYDLYEYGYYIIVTFVYGVSASMILPFVSVYTKKYVDIPYVDTKLAVLFMMIGFANNIRIPCLTMINAAGHFKETQWRAILEAVINITISLLLIKPLGMYGLLIGTICSFVYRSTDIIYYSHKYILNFSCKRSVLRVLRAVLVIVFNVILYRFLVGKYIVNSWGEWIMYAVIASAITLLTTGLVYFTTEKKQFLACLNMVFKRKSNSLD